MPAHEHSVYDFQLTEALDLACWSVIRICDGNNPSRSLHANYEPIRTLKQALINEYGLPALHSAYALGSFTALVALAAFTAACPRSHGASPPQAPRHPKASHMSSREPGRPSMRTDLILACWRAARERTNAQPQYVLEGSLLQQALIKEYGDPALEAMHGLGGYDALYSLAKAAAAALKDSP